MKIAKHKLYDEINRDTDNDLNTVTSTELNSFNIPDYNPTDTQTTTMVINHYVNNNVIAKYT